MKPLFAFALGLALIGSVRFAAGDEPKKDDKLKKDDNAAKIVGTWELIKSDDATAPIGATVTFTKDGKLLVNATVNGQEIKIEGTYKVEKDKLLSEMKIGDMTMKDTDTIKKLTDDELELVDKDMKASVLNKKKK